MAGQQDKKVPWWVGDERVPQGMMMDGGAMEYVDGDGHLQRSDGPVQFDDDGKHRQILQVNSEDEAAIDAAKGSDPAERLRVYLSTLEVHDKVIQAGAVHAKAVLDEAKRWFEYMLRLEQRVIVMEGELIEAAEKRDDEIVRNGKLQEQLDELQRERDFMRTRMHRCAGHMGKSVVRGELSPELATELRRYLDGEMA